ncbi:MAG: zinc ribbon domain-containing protein [Kiritimatiellia bacterium]|nr:zinc ribbon domain-containing protein [Kiritimatiellia bacterium]
MPIREYQASNPENGCDYCRNRFERIERLNEPTPLKCPQCGADLIRLISAPSVGASQTGADDRAKRAGFHKLKKISHGEYEKMY